MPIEAMASVDAEVRTMVISTESSPSQGLLVSGLRISAPTERWL